MRNNPRVRNLLLAVFGLYLTASQSLAGPFVEHLSPPSFSRGTTSRLTLVGTELGGAVALWTSLPPKAVKATLIKSSRDDQAVFEVKVSPDAPLGVCGLRLATRSGLSNVKLFLIDDLPAVAERVANARDRVRSQNRLMRQYA